MLPAQINSVPAMSNEDIAKVRQAEEVMKTFEQVPIHTHHLIHGGLYARTIELIPGILITGVLIKRATTLIVSGHVTAYIGGKEVTLEGYHVLPASARRKQIFYAHDYTHLTMLFPTQAKTVEEAEAEFTDEVDSLMSSEREELNTVVVTGE